jgi:hypothetical protein
MIVISQIRMVQIYGLPGDKVADCGQSERKEDLRPMSAATPTDLYHLPSFSHKSTAETLFFEKNFVKID